MKELTRDVYFLAWALNLHYLPLGRLVCTGVLHVRMAQRMHRVSSLEEIEDILPIPSSRHKSSTTR